MIKLVICLIVLKATFSAKIPSSFVKCNRHQDDWKACVLKAAQEGIPNADLLVKQFGLPEVTPFQVAEATLGEGKGVVAVEQKFKNCKVFGLTDFKVDEFEFDFEKKTLKIVGVFSEIRKTCDYELDGKILLLPIQGKGPSDIKLKNLKVNLLLKYEEILKKQKHYIKFFQADLSLQPGFISYYFGNLFNGDKALADNVLKVLNENWKEVFEDVQDGYIELIKTIVFNVFNNFFAKVSIEEAFD